jgi:hypothetical protein
MFTFLITFFRRALSITTKQDQPLKNAATEPAHLASEKQVNSSKKHQPLAPPLSKKTVHGMVQAEPTKAMPLKAQASATSLAPAIVKPALSQQAKPNIKPKEKTSSTSTQSTISMGVIPSLDEKSGALETTFYPLLVAQKKLSKAWMHHNDLHQFVSLFESNTPAVFRSNIAALFEAKGFQVTLSEGETDLMIQRDGHQAWVHTCNNGASLTHVTEHAFGQKALMAAKASANGKPLIVVTAGRYGKSLFDIARTQKIMLLDGKILAKLMAAYHLIPLQVFNKEGRAHAA